jgi:hypothetical protein
VLSATGLGRRSGAGETGQTDAAEQADGDVAERDQDQRDGDLDGDISGERRADAETELCARSDRERGHAQGRQGQHPADDDQHHIGNAVRQIEQSGAPRDGDPGDGKAAQEREQDQGHDRALGRGCDDVGGHEAAQGFGERRHGRGRGGTGAQRFERRAVGRPGGQSGEGDERGDDRRDDQQSQKDEKGAGGDPAGLQGCARARGAGDDQRKDERDHRHPQSVQPDAADQARAGEDGREVRAEGRGAEDADGEPDSRGRGGSRQDGRRCGGVGSSAGHLPLTPRKSRGGGPVTVIAPIGFARSKRDWT